MRMTSTFSHLFSCARNHSINTTTKFLSIDWILILFYVEQAVVDTEKKSERMGRQEVGIYWLSFLFWAGSMRERERAMYALKIGIRRENLSAQQATKNNKKKKTERRK